MGHLPTILLDWIIGHMPGLILRTIYKEERIEREVTVQCVNGGEVYNVHGMQPRVKDVVLQITNHLPFPISAEDISGKLMHFDDTYIENLLLPVRQEVPKHASIEFCWGADVRALPGLGRRKEGTAIPLQILGRITIEAIGTKLSKEVVINFASQIRTD